MKCINIFNKKCFYESEFGLKSYIKALDMLAEEIFHYGKILWGKEKHILNN